MDSDNNSNKLTKEERLKELRKQTGKKAREFHKLFTSPIGKTVLQHLEDEFNPDVLKGGNDAETNYNVGRRDVIVYIQQMIRYEENARELEG